MISFEDAVDTARTCVNYVDFLYKISREQCRVLELGTEFGCSAQSFAKANEANFVWTVDVNPLSIEHVREINLSNIGIVIGDSRVMFDRFKSERFDMLFIDADHTFNSAWNDYSIYRDLVVDGGLIIVDDISYCKGMQVMWEMIPERKERLDWLHYRGFGLVQKQSSVTVPELGNVIAESLRRIGDPQ